MEDNDFNSGYVAPKIKKSNAPFVALANIKKPGFVKIVAKISKPKLLITQKSHLVVYESLISDKTGSVRAIWFNIPSVKYIDSGLIYILLGHIKIKEDKPTLVNPIFTTKKEYERYIN